MEEATLRAKIQAMKNLLQAKRQQVDRGEGAPASAATSYAHKVPHSGHYQPRKYTRPTPGNRSWNRFSPPVSVDNRSHASTGSVNKVWRREDAATMGAVVPANAGGKAKVVEVVRKARASNRPMKVSANKSTKVQVLRLEDGEYAKASGGFSLIRAGMKPVISRHSDTQDTVLTSAPRSNSNSVQIGGVKYVVANGGKALKRCVSEESKITATYKPDSMSLATKSLATKSRAARAVLYRAKATMQRARSHRLHAAKTPATVRTVYCSFYNRFGFCKNKDACRFIHDSRHVAMCRKFLKNECVDPKCLLAHQNDENKVPDCKMFLRGACTRENCKYRHVKVSATAEVCEMFIKGYCPKGGECLFRHELPLLKRKLPRPAALEQNISSNPPVDSGTLSPRSMSVSDQPLASSGPGRPHKVDPELSIRPNIRFASKHNAGFPLLFGGLRK